MLKGDVTDKIFLPMIDKIQKNSSFFRDHFPEQLAKDSSSIFVLKLQKRDDTIKPICVQQCRTHITTMNTNFNICVVRKKGGRSQRYSLWTFLHVKIIQTYINGNVISTERYLKTFQCKTFLA